MRMLMKSSLLLWTPQKEQELQQSFPVALTGLRSVWLAGHTPLCMHTGPVSVQWGSGSCNMYYSTSFVHLAGDNWVAYSTPLECPPSVNIQACLKWPTIFLQTATVLLTAHCDSSPSFTISCSVCAKHPKLATPRGSIAFITLLALSRKITWTLLLIFHAFSIPSIAVAFGLRYRIGRAIVVFFDVQSWNFDEYRADTDPEYWIEPSLINSRHFITQILTTDCPFVNFNNLIITMIINVKYHTDTRDMGGGIDK